MPTALSVDLRERVVAAIEAGALRHAAVKRFGVGAASAIRWHEQFREDGRIAPKPMGGDQRSRAIEADSRRTGGQATCIPLGQIYVPGHAFDASFCCYSCYSRYAMLRGA